MKITKGQKYLCIKEILLDHNPKKVAYRKGRVYKSDIDLCITDELGNKDHAWQGDGEGNYEFSDCFRPLPSAKWAIKRTPENADVVNRWANEKFRTEGNWEYSDGYVCYNGDIEDKLTSHYTEIDFNTFKQIVGIEEEKLPIEDNPHWNKEWTKPYKDFIANNTEQPTEEWQPNWGEEVEGYYVHDGTVIKRIKGRYLAKSNYKEHHLIENKEKDFIGLYLCINIKAPITEIPMSEALEIIAQAKGINKEQIKIVE